MVYAIEINETIFPGAKLNSFGVILSTTLPLLFTVATVLFLIYLIWGGIDWIRSGNNKENTIKAQAKWRYAILGYIVMIVSLLLVKLLGFVTGIPFHL